MTGPISCSQDSSSDLIDVTIFEQIMKPQIIEVQSKKELKQFIDLPASIYRDDKIWVNSISLIDKKLFKDIIHNKCRLFLALKEDRPVGRVAAFIDDNYDRKWTGESVGFWGSFESIKDYEVAGQLFETAEAYIRKHKKTEMRGPVNFIPQSMGFLSENYFSPPVIISTYNPPYYVDFAERYGFSVEKILIALIFDGRWGYKIPERFEKWFEKNKEKHRIKLRFVKAKDIKKEIVAIVDIVNRSYSNYWGFAPVSDEEGMDIAKMLSPVLNDKCVLLAEVDDIAIGFTFALPDIYIPLRETGGNVFPTGIFKFIKFLKKPCYYRLWALGVCPEYQRKAVDVLLYMYMYKALEPEKIILEANWVFDDNKTMMNAILKLGGEVYKRYKFYKKDL
jgi:hypothetical protein